MKSLLIFFLLSVAGLAQDLPAQFASHFEYDKSAPFDVKENSTDARGTARVVDLSYASPGGGRVPAYLVLPAGPGPFPAILYAHWRNPKNSPGTTNRTEFLDEAVVYAKAGTICLLIDAPFARPGFKDDPDPFSLQESRILVQQVVDIRRGIDLLLARRDVNPTRVGYVGHSYDAEVGGILRGIEPRIAVFVLMGGNYSTRAEINSDEPQIVAFRKEYGDKKINEYLDQMEWTDPVHYVSLPGKAPVLLQDATHDEFGSAALFEKTADAVATPKALKWYDAKHALNAQARMDRYVWLRKYLGLNDISEKSLLGVPDLQ